MNRNPKSSSAVLLFVFTIAIVAPVNGSIPRLTSSFLEPRQLQLLIVESERPLMRYIPAREPIVQVEDASPLGRVFTALSRWTRRTGSERPHNAISMHDPILFVQSEVVGRARGVGTFDATEPKHKREEEDLLPLPPQLTSSPPLPATRETPNWLLNPRRVPAPPLVLTQLKRRSRAGGAFVELTFYQAQIDLREIGGGLSTRLTHLSSIKCASKRECTLFGEGVLDVELLVLNCINL